MRRSTLAAAAGLALLLGGCAVREPRPEGAWLAEREAWFAEYPVWSVRGRLGLSDGERGGSLAMTWRADGDRHEVLLRTVAGGRQWRLVLDASGATLTGSDVGRMTGSDPDALVERAVGWPIPVRWMSRWLRGLPAPNEARVQFADDGTLARLAWQDWTLDFQRWRERDAGGVLLPWRVEARDAPHRVRAVLSDWRFEAGR